MEQKQPWQSTARWLRRGRRQRRIRQYDQGEVTRADGVERQNLRRTSVALTDFCYAIHNRAVGNRGHYLTQIQFMATTYVAIGNRGHYFTQRRFVATKCHLCVLLAFVSKIVSTACHNIFSLKRILFVAP